MDETVDSGIQIVSAAVEEDPEQCRIMESESESNEAFGSGTEMGKTGSLRGEVDTSAPFESVKEAVSLFGGIGYWKHSLNKLLETQNDREEIGIAKLEEQAAQLEKDLILKETETRAVLEDIESTKLIVEELKLKLHKEASEEADKENSGSFEGQCQNLAKDLICSSSDPSIILTELKQAKSNLNKNTNEIADIRASVVLFNKKLEKDRISLEKAKQRLTQNSSKISSLEEDLNRTKIKIQEAKDAAESKGGFVDNPVHISEELRKLSAEMEQFKKMGEIAKSEVLTTISEIEQAKTELKTAQFRLISAKKMKEAARAAELVALADVKVLSSHVNPSEDDGNVSNKDILKRVEEAIEEVKSSKQALEEALNSKAIHRRTSHHGQKRHPIPKSTKLENPYPAHPSHDSRSVDVNGVNVIITEPVMKPVLTIGEILSRKLLMKEGFESGVTANDSYVNRKESFEQMMSKKKNELTGKRQKFGFGQLSLLTKQTTKKKKTQSLDLK